MSSLSLASHERREIARQIGAFNVGAISGGRIRPLDNGISLPVSHGYSVEVELNALDYYDVRRVFARGGQRWIKGEMTNVPAELVGSAAYYASCFRSYDEDAWQAMVGA